MAMGGWVWRGLHVGTDGAGSVHRTCRLGPNPWGGWTWVQVCARVFPGGYFVEGSGRLRGIEDIWQFWGATRVVGGLLPRSRCFECPLTWVSTLRYCFGVSFGSGRQQCVLNCFLTRTCTRLSGGFGHTKWGGEGCVGGFVGRAIAAVVRAGSQGCQLVPVCSGKNYGRRWGAATLSR